MTIPLYLLGAHFLGDFLLQTDWMAVNKSKNPRALGLHCLVYSLCFIPCGLTFFGLTFLTHFVTDAVTSRITSKLWFFKPVGEHYNIGGERYELWIPRGGNRHYFFVVIGLDQLIHYGTLAWTYSLKAHGI